MAEYPLPRDFGSFDELPPEMQPFYAPVDGGFVPASAVNAVSEVWDMAHLQNNLYELHRIYQEKDSDMRATRQLLNSNDGLRVLYDPHNEMGGYGQQLEMAHEQLPERIGQIRSLLVFRNITVPIDSQFVDDLIAAYNAAELLPEHNPDDDPAVVSHLLEELKERNAAGELARSKEKVDTVAISGGRKINVVTDADGATLRLDLPLVKDPRKARVLLGDDAVIEILGARLTDRDYVALARSLLAVEGPAGDAVRDYERAVEAWVTAQLSGGHAPLATDHLFEASLPVRGTCKNDWLFIDIVLWSLQMNVIRRHPELDHMAAPQPYGY